MMWMMRGSSRAGQSDCSVSLGLVNCVGEHLNQGGPGYFHRLIQILAKGFLFLLAGIGSQKMYKPGANWGMFPAIWSLFEAEVIVMVSFEDTLT